MTTKLSPEQRKALDEHQGQPVLVVDADRAQTFVLLSAEEYQRVRFLLDPPSCDTGWTQEKDDRRCKLIDKDIVGTITEPERGELASLERIANEHYDAVSPPPIEGARRLHQQLLHNRPTEQ